jgi:hypothetical protein
MLWSAACGILRHAVSAGCCAILCRQGSRARKKEIVAVPLRGPCARTPSEPAPDHAPLPPDVTASLNLPLARSRSLTLAPSLSVPLRPSPGRAGGRARPLPPSLSPSPSLSLPLSLPLAPPSLPLSSPLPPSRSPPPPLFLLLSLAHSQALGLYGLIVALIFSAASTGTCPA